MDPGKGDVVDISRILKGELPAARLILGSSSLRISFSVVFFTLVSGFCTLRLVLSGASLSCILRLLFAVTSGPCVRRLVLSGNRGLCFTELLYSLNKSLQRLPEPVEDLTGCRDIKRKSALAYDPAEHFSPALDRFHEFFVRRRFKPAQKLVILSSRKRRRKSVRARNRSTCRHHCNTMSRAREHASHVRDALPDDLPRPRKRGKVGVEEYLRNE